MSTQTFKRRKTIILVLSYDCKVNKLGKAWLLMSVYPLKPPVTVERADNMRMGRLQNVYHCSSLLICKGTKCALVAQQTTPRTDVGPVRAVNHLFTSRRWFFPSWFIKVSCVRDVEWRGRPSRAAGSRGGDGPHQREFRGGGDGRPHTGGGCAYAARAHQHQRHQVLAPAHRAQVRVRHAERRQHGGGQRWAYSLSACKQSDFL